MWAIVKDIVITKIVLGCFIWFPETWGKMVRNTLLANLPWDPWDKFKACLRGFEPQKLPNMRVFYGRMKQLGQLKEAIISAVQKRNNLILKMDRLHLG